MGQSDNGSVNGDRPAYRSRKWFQGDGLNASAGRAWLRSQGHAVAMFDGRPVIGVINSWADAK